MTSSFSTLRQAWNDIVHDHTLSSLQSRAVKGTLCKQGLHSLSWKIFLGYLPTLELAGWPAQLAAQRERYKCLRRTHIEEPAEKIKNSKDAQDLSDNNPLALNESNPWQKHFECLEIRKVIRQDVDRTFQEKSFFCNEDVQARMTDILFVYCQSTSTSYIQGMHELLAWIYWVVDTDSINRNTVKDETDEPEIKLMLNVLDATYVEHDAYILFEKLMQHASIWYETQTPKGGMTSHVVSACHRIQNDHLSKADPDLYKHLKSISIEPQIYGIRWLRLLFGREFETPGLLKLWGAMFAVLCSNPSPDLVEFIGVAFLLQMRDDLIHEREYTGCMTMLMRNSANLPPDALVSQGTRLRDNLSTVTTLSILQENDRLRNKPPRQSLKDGLDLLAETPDDDLVPKNRPSHRRSQGSSLDGFADVWKSQQFREWNRTIAGVVKNVQKNVHSFGENVRSGLPVDASTKAQYNSSGDHRWNERTSFDFPPNADRVLNRVISREGDDTSSSTRSLSINRQMGELMEKCIHVMESELFLDDVTHMSHKDPKDGPPKMNEANLVMSLAGLKHVRDVLCGKQVNFDPKVFNIDSPKQQRQTVSAPTSITNTSTIPAPVHPPPREQPSGDKAQGLSHIQPQVRPPRASSRGSTIKAQFHVEAQEDPLDPLDAKNVDKKMMFEHDGLY